MKNTVYSFDIFDTCLIRACGKPEMVFSLLAQELGNNDRAFVMDFVKRRMKAEQDARLALKKEAVTFDEIYDYFDLTSINQDRNTVMNLEFALEERMLYPVYDVLERIKHLHKEGNHIIYISDMYLPSSFLEKILQKWGFWNEADILFVSGECACTKQSGNLYRYAARKLNMSFRNWHHYGDNPIGDGKMPRRLGIKAHIIKNTYSRYEEKWIKDSDKSFDSEICNYFAGASRTIRLSNKPDPRIDIAADVIAPVYIPFVFHVLNHAQEKGITHLYFTARDSFIFYTIAQKLTCLFPDIKLFYIYLSRRAIFLPSLYECNQADYDECLYAKLEGLIPENILKTFNISPEEISEYIEIDSDIWQTKLTKDTVFDFYKILLNPRVKKMISLRSLEARVLLLDYLKQEQLLENIDHAALVDLGWNGSCRNALNKILLREGYKNIYTYYWGVGQNRLLYACKDSYDAYIFLEKINYFSHQSVIKIMEHYFSLTTHGSTIGYINNRDNIKPVFDNNDINLGVIEISELNLAIVNQITDILLWFPNIKKRIKYSFAICGLSSLETFIVNPVYNEATTFKKVIFENPLT
jgi:predicted HAD superfamily hydrolase